MSSNYMEKFDCNSNGKEDGRGHGNWDLDRGVANCKTRDTKCLGTGCFDICLKRGDFCSPQRYEGMYIAPARTNHLSAEVHENKVNGWSQNLQRDRGALSSYLPTGVNHP